MVAAGTRTTASPPNVKSGFIGSPGRVAYTPVWKSALGRPNRDAPHDASGRPQAVRVRRCRSHGGDVRTAVMTCGNVARNRDRTEGVLRQIARPVSRRKFLEGSIAAAVASTPLTSTRGEALQAAQAAQTKAMRLVFERFPSRSSPAGACS